MISRVFLLTTITIIIISVVWVIVDSNASKRDQSSEVKYTKEFIVDAHKACNIDKAELLMSDSCACFHCLKVYSTKEIIDWTLPAGELGENAICPYCGIDAVISSKSGLPVNDPEFLQTMYDYWF